jgi:FkbM family methyltransferase
MSLLESKRNYQSGTIEKGQYINEMYHFHDLLFQYCQLQKATDIKEITLTEDGIVFTSRKLNVKIFSDKADKRAAPFEILNFDVYEKIDSQMVFRLIEPDFNILDIGANIGWYSLNIAKLYPKTKITSFEPIPSTFVSLKKNIEINDVDNIQIYNFGLSNEEKSLKFYLQPDMSVSASATNITGSNNIAEITCNVKRLDDFIKEIDSKIDFIKCDVEGAELFVFQGGIRTIQVNTPIIFTEMLRKWSAKFNYHPNEIISLLGEFGYLCFAVNKERLIEIPLMDENTIETNFFFLHSEKHADKIKFFTNQSS